MQESKRKIGEVIKDTEGFGDVTIVDIYYSPHTNKEILEVESDSGDSFLCVEEDLV